MDHFIFSGMDYLVFVFMLVTSTVIGIYFGFIAKKANTTDEYLMGSRKMKTIPIAISLVTSMITAISFMAFPSEIYVYGINFFFECVAIFIVVPILCWIIVPVFYNNNIINSYEYLELRYNRALREFMTIIFLFNVLIILPVFNYTPSLAFAQVTSVNIHIINAIVSSVCVFYTMFGGIKAVVWTDVVQGTIMMFSVAFIAVMGTIKVGGFSKILKLASEGGRLTPDFTFDLKTRVTFWNTFTSSVFARVSYVSFNPSYLQRLASLSTLGKAKRCLMMFGLIFFLFMIFNCFTGITMYALYHDCDPVKTGLVERPDKLVPYFVQDVAGHLKGIPGLFISCVFSAALSTISAFLNTLPGIIYMDYIKPKIKHTENRANFIMKIIVLLLGIYSILCGFIVEKFSSVLQLTYIIVGSTLGAICGVFTMGMLVPRAHAKAAISGGAASIIVMFIIIFGSSGKVSYTGLPTSTVGCSEALNFTMMTPKNISVLQQLTKDTHNQLDDNFDIFKMSFNWYMTCSSLIVFIVGIPLSYLLPPGKNEKLDIKLLSPIVQSFVKYQLTNTEEPEEMKI